MCGKYSWNGRSRSDNKRMSVLGKDSLLIYRKGDSLKVSELCFSELQMALFSNISLLFLLTFAL